MEKNQKKSFCPIDPYTPRYIGLKQELVIEDPCCLLDQEK